MSFVLGLDGSERQRTVDAPRRVPPAIIMSAGHCLAHVAEQALLLWNESADVIVATVR